MRYARIISKLYAEPVLLSMPAWSSFDAALAQIMNGGSPVLSQMQAMKHSSHMSEQFDRNRMAAEPQGPNQKAWRGGRVLEMRSVDTAIVYLSGVVDKHVSLMELDCYGGIDLDDIDDALRKCLNDPAIKNIMIVFDTPGGSVVGVHETAMLVAELAARKNVFAFSDSICASAGYYIASQCSQIFTTYSASYGSIGVYCALLDYTKWLDEQGVTVNLIKAGKFKAMGAPFKKLEPAESALIQERTNKIYDMFTDTVQTARPQVSIDTMQGQCFFGEDNIAVGLADVLVRSLDQALAEF